MTLHYFLLIVGLYSALGALSPLLAATAPAHMTLLQQCIPLPVQYTTAQFEMFEQCTKQDGPARLATYFADIYQKTEGKVSLAYLDDTTLVLHDIIEDNPERFQRFELWGCNNTKRYCVIVKWGWEQWRYLLIDRKTKLATELIGHPVFSPDSELVLEYLDSRLADTFSHNILKLYRLSDSTPKLLLDHQSAEYGVHSAQWLSPHSLQAIIQGYAPDGDNRLITVGTLQLEVDGDEVNLSINQSPAQDKIP